MMTIWKGIMEISRNITNSPDDYFEIVFFLEEYAHKDIGGFEEIKSTFEKVHNIEKKIDKKLFFKRAALMVLDKNAISYLLSADRKDLKDLINDIAPDFHPLMAAVRRRDHEGVMFLLENGADPNQGSDPWLPLLQADKLRDKKMVEILERYGADWDKSLHIFKSWKGAPYIRKT